MKAKSPLILADPRDGSRDGKKTTRAKSGPARVYKYTTVDFEGDGPSTKRETIQKINKLTGRTSQ